MSAWARNGECGLGNNYCLSILLENHHSAVDAAGLDRAFKAFAEEYGTMDR